MLKSYYYLTKPGIIYGNLLFAAAGFLLASKTNLNLWLLLITLSAISLIIASACIINNFFDREIDSKMERTKNRVLVKNKISTKNALIYSGILGFVGFLALFLYTNLLTVIAGFIGFFVYTVIYGYLKRTSIHSTLIGGISGAMPPVAGYTAVTNNFDLGALLLFLILMFWQMPHFYAIGIYRFNDYKNANIPLYPIVKGVLATKIHIIIYIIAVLTSCILLTIFRYTGITFLILATFVNFIWLFIALKGFKTTNETAWAKKVFKFSIVVTMSIYLLIAFNIALP